MALKTCHECGREYSDEAKACIHCGASNPDREGPGGGCFKTVVIVASVLLFLTILGVAISPKTPPEIREEKRRARDAIDLCHDQRDDELRELSERRYIRAICQKMESDFRAKYGVDP